MKKTLNPIVPKNSKWRFGEMTFASKKISENNTQTNFNLNMYVRIRMRRPLRPACRFIEFLLKNVCSLAV